MAQFTAALFSWRHLPHPTGVNTVKSAWQVVSAIAPFRTGPNSYATKFTSKLALRPFPFLSLSIEILSGWVAVGVLFVRSFARYDLQFLSLRLNCYL